MGCELRILSVNGGVVVVVVVVGLCVCRLFFKIGVVVCMLIK